ncbi:hypothetical protein [Pelomonas sp. Root1217]|uniref:hypothetical protein n=1 Tax=Pelomonas sp. Root1217 TaxID=1736430 RepID=UPI00070C13D4|nr:hypothetical protein [Pelomonas sp. Root1217]
MSAKKTATTARFILMPMRGFTSEDMRNISEASPVFAAAATNRLATMSATGRSRTPVMKVVHSIEADGPKLVEMGS